MKRFNTKTLVLMSLLVAIQVVLSRFFSINAWNLKIGFAFAPVALSGILLGVVPTAIVAVVADVLGALLFPSGMFFPGFTLTALLHGTLYGLLLHKTQHPVRIGLAVVVDQLVLGLMLNTLWISILYGSPYWGVLLTRILQCAIMIPVEFVVITMLAKFGKRVARV